MMRLHMTNINGDKALIKGISMQITYLDLSECYKEIINRAEKQGYIWVMSLIARYADCEEIYEKIEHDWESLNDLTSNKILFLFSSPSCKKNTSFFRAKEMTPYEGCCCPYIVMLGKKRIDNNRGGFEYNYPDFEKIDWKLKHSQSISKFAQEFSIKESQIPCLFFYNLRNGKLNIIPLTENMDVYKIVKYIISEIDGLYNKLENNENQIAPFRKVERYLQLFIELDEKAENGNISQKLAIQAVLNNQKEYREVKSTITDSSIKKDLKRLKQWERHWVIPFLQNAEQINEYITLKKEREEITEEIEQKLEAIDLKSCSTLNIRKGKMVRKDKIHIFMSYNWSDNKIAKMIYDDLSIMPELEIHIDREDINLWESIKEFMESIEQMDFVILVISDQYLKSVNCMYEVIEVMKLKDYRNKIFPIVVDKNIYKPENKLKYVKYWREKYLIDSSNLKDIEVDAIGEMGTDLKITGYVKNNIADFLNTICDMNNPEIDNAGKTIVQKLISIGAINGEKVERSNYVTTLENEKEKIPDGMISTLMEMQKILINCKE